MKHLLTLTALLISSLAMGQMPYNPDSNGDYLIGASDLVSFLGLYNTLMVDTALTCSYEGTEFESWMGSLFDGSLMLDSIYVEYLYQDSVETYLPGCPDPVFIETVLERSYLFKPGFQTWPFADRWEDSFFLFGKLRRIQLDFNDDAGEYRIKLTDAEMGELTNFDQDSYMTDGSVFKIARIPFPQNWTLDEDGIQVDWQLGDWVANCQNFRLIPYWHYAE